MLNEIHSRFVKLSGLPVTIGIGQTYDLDLDCSQISNSFIEAVTAVQYKAIKGSNQTIKFQETEAKSLNSDWYPIKEIERFELLLRKRETEAAMGEGDKLIRGIREKSGNLYMAKHISLEIVNRVIRTMDDLLGTAANRLAYPDAMTFARCERLDELEQVVRETCIGACRELTARQAEDESPIEALKHYVEQQAFQFTFSVQSMADHFGFSKVHISRVFKDCTGKTIMEAVYELRLQESQRLLKETGMALQDIVKQIGYSDVSSFIRKFKQEIGMTPGEYRKLFNNE